VWNEWGRVEGRGKSESVLECEECNIILRKRGGKKFIIIIIIIIINNIQNWDK
jgi:hypothetical protein